MRGCSAGWQEDELCCTSKQASLCLTQEYSHLSAENYTRGQRRKSIFNARCISRPYKYVHCFHAPAHPLAPLWLHRSKHGVYSCGILIWDLWSLIAHEQRVILRGGMSRCAVWPEALWVCIAERGKVWPDHWQLIRAHALQVVQVVEVQRSLFVCVCEREIDSGEIANKHSL